MLNFTLFGITSGAAIFMAQYWGARDIAGIRKVMGMCLLLGFTACAFFSTIGGGLAVGIGLIVFFGRDLALSVYSLTRSGTQAASDVLAVLSFAVIFRAFNPTIIGGIWRSGGDTRFSAVLDTSAVWLVALPQAYLGAFVFYLPNQWVVACVLSEGLYKMIIGLFRVASKKWINNRIQPV